MITKNGSEAEIGRMFNAALQSDDAGKPVQKASALKSDTTP
jgi:hypothetical protein